MNGRLLLRLGALFHDVGKAATQTIDPEGRIRFLGHEKAGADLTGRILRRLSLSNEAIAIVKKIVAGHMRPLHLANSGGHLSRRAVYRYFRATAASGINIALLSLADHLATYNGTGPEKQWHKGAKRRCRRRDNRHKHFARCKDERPFARHAFG